MPGYRTFLGIDKVKKCAVVVLCNNNNSVTDIGRHLLDPGSRVEPYRYPWALVDTLRSTLRTKGVNAAVALYDQPKAVADSRYTFNEAQLNSLGDEYRRNYQLAEAIRIDTLNAREYPNSAAVYESLAATYMLAGDTAQARSYFEAARGLEPNNPHWAYMPEKIGKK